MILWSKNTTRSSSVWHSCIHCCILFYFFRSLHQQCYLTNYPDIQWLKLYILLIVHKLKFGLVGLLIGFILDLSLLDFLMHLRLAFCFGRTSTSITRVSSSWAFGLQQANSDLISWQQQKSKNINRIPIALFQGSAGIITLINWQSHGHTWIQNRGNLQKLQQKEMDSENS